MNKRIKKKKVKYLLNNVQKIGLKDNEFLVFKFNTKIFKPDQISKFAQYVAENISDRIIFVPIDTQTKVIVK